MIRKATGHFFPEKENYFTTPNGDNHYEKKDSGAYEYLMGALALCFYSTLRDIDTACKWREVEIKAQGQKRKESPTTLEYTSLEIVGYNVTDKEEFEGLVKKTTETCSIFQTISKVSEMDVVIRFEDNE